MKSVPLDTSQKRKQPKRDVVISLINQPGFSEEEQREVDRDKKDAKAVRTVDGRYYPEGRRDTKDWERSTVGMVGRNHRNQHCRYWVTYGNCIKENLCNFAHDRQAQGRGHWEFENWYQHAKVSSNW